MAGNGSLPSPAPSGAHPPTGGTAKRQKQKQKHGWKQERRRPDAAGARTDGYEAHARLLSVQNGRPQRHPARLVGDAVEILGRAQETIRGKACRTAIRKARASLIEMLEGPRRAVPAGSGGGGSAGGRQRRRRKRK